MLIWINTPTAKVGCSDMESVECLLRQNCTISHYEWESKGIRHIAICKPLIEKIEEKGGD